MPGRSTQQDLRNFEAISLKLEPLALVNADLIRQYKSWEYRLIFSQRRGQRASRNERGLNRPGGADTPTLSLTAAFGQSLHERRSGNQLCRRKRKQSVSRSVIGQCGLMALLVGAAEGKNR
jgi:hypothetical protein